MAKRVMMVAEILGENCTGCNLCSLVCPTSAIEMRPRRDDEPGPSRTIAVLGEDDCYNAQNCLEMCPDAAIVMRPLDEPFEVGVVVEDANADAVAALCHQARLLPDQLVCVCTDTQARELAASIVLGASAPEEVALATGARTGCTEICLDPILRLLAAAGHGDAPRKPAQGYQWYGVPGQMMEHVGADGKIDPELQELYPHFPWEKDINALTFNLEGA
jgi:NAD-dependent dihydropyrimidine dehydrogenase PreA subunit